MKTERRQFIRRLIPWLESLNDEEKNNYFLTKDGRLVKIKGRAVKKAGASHEEIVTWINKPNNQNHEKER